MITILYKKWLCGHTIDTKWPHLEKCWYCLRQQGWTDIELDEIVKQYKISRGPLVVPCEPLILHF